MGNAHAWCRSISRITKSQASLHTDSLGLYTTIRTRVGVHRVILAKSNVRIRDSDTRECTAIFYRGRIYPNKVMTRQ